MEPIVGISGEPISGSPIMDDRLSTVEAGRSFGNGAVSASCVQPKTLVGSTVDSSLREKLVSGKSTNDTVPTFESPLPHTFSTHDATAELSVEAGLLTGHDLFFRSSKNSSKEDGLPMHA
jgi:hypothetical protein